MKVLVTGATGFVGQRIASRLREAGYDLRIATRLPQRLSGHG
ncbi:NAD-dependent epimerase/dehydratase family protein [Mesorhizobium atlanticum]